MKKISKFILCNLFGWKLFNQFPPDLKKYLIIVAPHTSWIDFPIGILAKTSYGIKANYIGKHTLFKPPYGFIFRALGGTPVNRSKSANRVEGIIDLFNTNENFILEQAFINAFSFEFSIAQSSISILTISLAPIFSAKIERIPVPHPQSKMRLP